MGAIKRYNTQCLEAIDVLIIAQNRDPPSFLILFCGSGEQCKLWSHEFQHNRYLGY